MPGIRRADDVEHVRVEILYMMSSDSGFAVTGFEIKASYIRLLVGPVEGVDSRSPSGV